MKRSFFQAAVVSILLYGCTTWTLTKRLERKLNGNYTRMLRAILNKSWRQHPTRHQLYGHRPPITKTIQGRRTRHAGHCWRSIMSCRLHGYPWPFLAIPPYCSSLLAGPQYYIPYPHRATICRFELVVLLLLGHVKGSIAVYLLWARPCFSSSVLHVWFV